MATSNDLKKFFGKLNKTLAQAVTPKQMKYLGGEAAKLVVKRTRLGYGVKENKGERFKLSSIKWSPMYQAIRKAAGKKGTLDETTSPKKSNLTFTGQMLRSFGVVKANKSNVTLDVSGTRRDGQTNKEVAAANAKRGRVFNRLSVNEYNQLVRIYRRSFTDLLKRIARVG